MLNRIMFIILAFSPMIGLCENAEYKRSELAERIMYKGGFEVRIITEKQQSVENGLRFSIELENNLSEPVSFITRKRIIPLKPILKENDVPFVYSIYLSPPEDNKQDLAELNDSNVDALGYWEMTRRIDIDKNSIMQLGSVEFVNYMVPSEVEGRNQAVEKIITPGTYTVKMYIYGILIIDNEDPDTLNVDVIWNRGFTVFSEPVEIVLK